jgi:hypothetical protein
MPRKRIRRPPAEPVEALVRKLDNRTFVPQCSRCGQHLPKLIRMPKRMFEGVTNPAARALSPYDLYIAAPTMGGWRLDNGTLRPTPHHREERETAHLKASTVPRDETRRIRRNLRGRPPSFARPWNTGNTYNRQVRPHLYPAPERVECPRCEAICRLALDQLAAHDAVR